MTSFTYEPPNETVYQKAVLLALDKAGYTDLHKVLANAKCSINVRGTYSYVRWNGVNTSVSFEIPMKDYETFTLDDEEKNTLRSICNHLMPPSAGLDVLSVNLIASLYEQEGDTLEQDLLQTSKSLEAAASEFTLTIDILSKGKEMAEVYLYLCVTCPR